jgi:putative aldouronate transport system permease protein
MTDAERVARPLSIIPQTFNWAGYKMVFAPNSNILVTYWTTIKRAVIGTGCNLVMTSLFAYVLAKRQYPFRLFLTAMLAFTMWFDAGLIPNYLLNQSLGLRNNFWVYVIPAVISPWNCIILRNFIMALPSELEESAKIDGANEGQILVCIVLPLCKASLATIGLFYAVWHWNSWFDSMLYMSDRRNWCLQYVLRQIISSANMSELMEQSADATSSPPTEMVRMACTVAATVPILCVYPFLQKYFVKGVMIGSVKG